jgi:hypothetical protein
VIDEPSCLYEGKDLCPELDPSHLCIVLEQYKAGVFERQFHRHVPRHRLSDAAKAITKYFFPSPNPWEIAIKTKRVS